MKHLLWLATFGLVLGSSAHVFAQTEIAVISPASIRPALEEVLPGFESKTGNKVKVVFGNGGKNIDTVTAGTVTFDLAILQPPYTEVLSSGNVVTSGATQITRAPIGVAVKLGASRPDISTPEAVKQMLLAAKSITYPAAAGGAKAGISFDETLNRLAIFDQVRAKLYKGQNGPAAVARGDVDLYITFLSEMVVPGIDIIGALPESISTPVSFVGFVSTKSKDPEAADALLQYLVSPAAQAVYKTHRMLPPLR